MTFAIALDRMIMTTIGYIQFIYLFIAKYVFHTKDFFQIEKYLSLIQFCENEEIYKWKKSTQKISIEIESLFIHLIVRLF